MPEEIVICKSCGRPEYWGEMRWLSGRSMCRSCYKADFEAQTRKLYTWDDLDGKRPTKAEYEAQEARNEERR
jgi:hypothetical protein